MPVVRGKGPRRQNGGPAGGTRQSRFKLRKRYIVGKQHFTQSPRSVVEGYSMDRRTFLGVASAAILAKGLSSATTLAAAASAPIKPLKPMAVGLLVNPFSTPEATFRRVHDMGFSNCFLSLDSYLNGFTQIGRAHV